MRLFVRLGAVCLLATAMFAQSTTSLSQFTAESVLNIDQLTASSTLTLSQSVIDAAEAGAIELRQQVTYDPDQKIVHVVGFQVAPGAPLPTEGVQTASTLWAFDVRIDEILMNQGQANGVVMTGVYLNGASPFENAAPSSAVISFTYTSGASDASFQGISVSLVGAGATFAASGKGVIGVKKPAVTAVASPHGASVSSLNFTLDGSKSSSAAGGPLTYQWQFLPASGQTAMLVGDNTANLQVNLPPGDPFVYGDYTFRLTVTNAAGVSASDTVTISVVNPNE